MSLDNMGAKVIIFIDKTAGKSINNTKNRPFPFKIACSR
jgi:hypothetical protein